MELFNIFYKVTPNKLTIFTVRLFPVSLNDQFTKT